MTPHERLAELIVLSKKNEEEMEKCEQCKEYESEPCRYHFEKRIVLGTTIITMQETLAWVRKEIRAFTKTVSINLLADNQELRPDKFLKIIEAFVREKCQ